FLPDVPRRTGIAAPARHQRDVVAGEWPLSEGCPRISKAAMQTDVVRQLIARAVLPAQPLARVTIDVQKQRGNEMDLVVELHHISAAFEIEPSPSHVESVFDVVGCLGLEAQTRRRNETKRAASPHA